MKAVSIGIAGTAKNTGKTTALSALIKGLKNEAELTLGLTGIGYDGESFDNVTRLPKPRIDVFAGMVVAVAQKCFRFSRAKVEPLMETGVSTSMGEVIIGRVTAPGKLVLAGPTKKSDLRKILDYMSGFGANVTIVDGALGRIAPFAETDGFILSTGAARSSDIKKLAFESGSMMELLKRPVLPEKGVVARVGSVLTEDSLNDFISAFSSVDTIVVEGLISGGSLAALAKKHELKGKRLLITDPLKLLLAGDISATGEIIRKAEETLEIGVQKPVRVIAVTVNPFYPKYRYKTADYEEAYVDKEALLNEITKTVGIVCCDVVAQGPQALLEEVLKFWRSRSA